MLHAAGQGPRELGQSFAGQAHAPRVGGCHRQGYRWAGSAAGHGQLRRQARRLRRRLPRSRCTAVQPACVQANAVTPAITPAPYAQASRAGRPRTKLLASMAHSSPHLQPALDWIGSDRAVVTANLWV